MKDHHYNALNKLDRGWEEDLFIIKEKEGRVSTCTPDRRPPGPACASPLD